MGRGGFSLSESFSFALSTSITRAEFGTSGSFLGSTSFVMGLVIAVPVPFGRIEYFRHIFFAHLWANLIPIIAA